MDFVCMLIDHIGVLFFPSIVIFRCIGRLSMPLYVKGLAEGLHKTGNFRHYLGRLSICAILAQIPYSLLFDTIRLNIVFGFVFGSVVLHGLRSNKVKPVLKALLFMVGLGLSFFVEYGPFMLVLLLGVFFDSYILSVISHLGLIFLHGPVQSFMLFWHFVPDELMHFRPLNNKWLRLALYPGHLFVLLILKRLR